MSVVKELILDKLEQLEILSKPALKEVLDFVSFLEWRLETNQQSILSSNPLPKEDVEATENTSSFLLEIASSFADGLSDEDLERLPTDGAENHDRYLYNNQV
ncbi:hypothetical protein [Pseudanabaena sp. 'Roaring Creek']|uniref:hypothetical protein n=1 Tax=Pseudanabaena sp. 'Roaring Creek' TaxID=1681830 RepID=UPI0006D82EBB|nr:hypothetical protein [Pseudanabaena sp. 'Roaring Creek']